jgi:5-methylcytosine-specific restriction enzyme subunit McrC
MRYMSDLLELWEHYHEPVVGFDLNLTKEYQYNFVRKRRQEPRSCVHIYESNKIWHAKLSYFVGVDWISEGKAIYVAPKLNNDSQETNVLQMLFAALANPDLSDHVDDLFEVKWDKEPIAIFQKQDLLTPLLAILFLRVVQGIVRKGLRKSYYTVDENLAAKIKGKVLVGQTLKQNLLKNKPIYSFCRYSEFGLNNVENRLLKKALTFVQRYLPSLSDFGAASYTQQLINYINPAFETVSSDIDVGDVKHGHFNAFYKDYEEGIHLAKLILRRFGYNISSIKQQAIVKSPPFWIDMSKLFELYVLGLLRASKQIIAYQVQGHYGQPDYLLPALRMIADAKYKQDYAQEFSRSHPYSREKMIADIRQVSGYARDKKLLAELNMEEEECQRQLVDCLIIYPSSSDDGQFSIDLDKKTAIPEFASFFKLPVRLPVLYGY